MGNLKSCFFVFIIAIISCGKSSFNHPQDDLVMIHLPEGNVNMYGETGFVIHIPELEVMKYEVSNANFEKFVEATHYITTAEKNNEGMVYEKDKGGWVLKTGADWKHPQGPDSDIKNKPNHPVVQVSNEDACAYCEWIGMRLPYESEWEYIFQLDEKNPPMKKNIWEGIFPIEDKGNDGFKGTAPIGNYDAGATGCYDLQGNVWERCLDYYHENWPQLGIEMNDSLRYSGPAKSFVQTNIYDTVMVIKGGSFLCADNYCRGYTNQIRMHADKQLGYEHVGFRCVKAKK